MEAHELSRFMNHQVTIRMSEKRAQELYIPDKMISGKVTNVSPLGLVLSAKSTVTILRAEDIDDIRFRRGRIVTRVVRVFSKQDDVRQHLVDRHGSSVSMLRTVSPDAALIYHEKLDHTDLGHHHGDRPGTRAVDPVSANRVMEELDEMQSDD